MSREIRKCEPDDSEKIWELLSYSYGIPQSSRDGFLKKFEIIGCEFYIYERGDNTVATARAIPFEQNIRGIMKPMIGSAMVASSPEHRMKGYVKELVLGILRNARVEGVATSTLYPFKDIFYMRMGYTKMHPVSVLQIDPRTLSRIVMPHGYSVSREHGDTAFEAWRTIHEEAVGEIHGAVRRNDTRWKEITADYNGHVVIARNSEGKPEGVVAYTIKGYGEGYSWAPTGEVSIKDIHWTTLPGRDCILNYLHRHSDQVVKMEVIVSQWSDDYYHWLHNIHTPNLRAHTISMARIVGVENALTGIPVRGEGTVALEVVDGQVPENSGVYRITCSDGILDVVLTQEPPDANLTIEGLTSLLYGSLNHAQLRSLGWFNGSAMADKIFEWVSKSSYWLTEEF